MNNRQSSTTDETPSRGAGWKNSCTKCLKLFTAFLFLLANGVHIYAVITFFDRSECYPCTQPATIVPWFVWFTSWNLWISTTAFCLYCLITKKLEAVSEIFIKLSVPWSITVTISYTFFILTTPIQELIDKDLCRNVADSAVPWTVPEAAATAFFVFDRFANIFIHYGCALITLSLWYASRSRKEQTMARSWIWSLFFPIFCYFVISVIIALVHTFVDEVYCTDSVVVSVSMSFGVFVVTALIRYALERYWNKQIEIEGGDDGDVEALRQFGK